MNKQDEIPRYSPEKLLMQFNQTRFGMIIVMAVAIHVVFIAAFSTGYIRDVLDPVGARQRKEKVEAASKNTASNAAPGMAASTQATAVAAAGASNPAAKAVAVSGEEAAMLSGRTNTAIMKQITETAKPDEIPKTPGNMTLSPEELK